MNTTVFGMMNNPKKILDAIERNEVVTLTREGKLIPIHATKRTSMKNLDAFGMWADRDDMLDPVAYIRELRGGQSA